ncbi:hypothetical protein AB6A40_009250 [Gnathostoma spinigerum]|uniref:Uncharacterized protein n=1 Tax=Gnathostoma spinigerum TaxID=75299 RepID=A0ABD6EYJ1_9BILA
MKVLEARQRITTLETAVKGCEQFDASLAECQAWCDHVQVILSCRAANDITAFDVPHEYQIAFASSSLVSQLQAEFDDFERCIESLRDFVLKAKDEWGGSNRFQLQLNHLIDQRDQLVNSFNEFKQPIRLEEKAERLSREVIEIENTLDELTGLNANECAEALGTAKHLQRRIVQANTDLCELAVCKTNLQQSRVMTITTVDDLTSRLNATADKLEALKQRSTEVIERLEKCIGLIQSLEKELTNLDIVVDDVETKLKTFEGKTVSDVSPTDRVRLDEMQTELNKHETSLANVEKIVESLKRDSVKVDEDEIEKRWMRLRRTRGDVRGWIETLDV